ncbi:MAG: SAF domain-containing protein [Clostridia bacterium]|nr:SAF domain-containing protein [Clostridia bacterium]
MSFKNLNSQIKAEKAPKSAGKKPFSSRTVIGVVCIIMALAVTFGVAPLLNRFADQKVDIVRLKTDIERGSVISEEDLETVNVGAYNLPDNVIKDKNYVIRLIKRGFLRLKHTEMENTIYFPILRTAKSIRLLLKKKRRSLFPSLRASAKERYPSQNTIWFLELPYISAKMSAILCP